MESHLKFHNKYKKEYQSEFFMKLFMESLKYQEPNTPGKSSSMLRKLYPGSCNKNG